MSTALLYESVVSKRVAFVNLLINHIASLGE